MKALLVSDSYPPLIGGATRATQQLAEALLDAGHEPAVATSWQRGAPASEHDGICQVRRIRAAASHLPGTLVEPRYTPPPVPDPGLVRGLREAIGEFAPDVIHAYGWMALSTVVANRVAEVPVVLAARDYGNVCARRTLLFEGREPCSGPGWRKCLGCAGQEYGIAKGAVGTTAVLGGRRILRDGIAGLHSVSRYVEEVMDTGLLGDREVARIIAPDWRSPSGGEPDREALAKLPAEPFILYVGALRRVKGIAELLGAHAALDDAPPLVLIGTEAPDTPPIPESVTVLRGVTPETVLAAWDRALFGVAPSIWAEPLGNVVHEAMSRGRPVIGSATGGHADMIDPGVDGLLVDTSDAEQLRDALELLSGDDALRGRLGAAARESAERFTEPAVAPRLIGFLESIA